MLLASLVLSTLFYVLIYTIKARTTKTSFIYSKLQFNTFPLQPVFRLHSFSEKTSKPSKKQYLNRNTF